MYRDSETVQKSHFRQSKPVETEMVLRLINSGVSQSRNSFSLFCSMTDDRNILKYLRQRWKCD